MQNTFIPLTQTVDTHGWFMLVGYTFLPPSDLVAAAKPYSSHRYFCSPDLERYITTWIKAKSFFSQDREKSGQERHGMVVVNLNPFTCLW